MPAGNLVLRAALVLGCAASAVGLAGADNWSRFRGPNGAGVSADKYVPVKWDDNHGLLWKVELPGQGHSSPIVWGDKVFVQSASLNGHERLLLCLSVKDGKVLWSRSIPGQGAHTHPKNTLASSTPATDGERVYAAFWDGKDIDLVAFDMDGKQLWKKDLGPYRSEHGAGCSPVVYGGRVYLANDQDGQAVLSAFDGKTGKKLWDSPRPYFRACYSSPLLRDLPGGAAELVVVSTMEITGYNPENGAKNWAWPWKFSAKKPLRTTASPLIVDNMVIACAGDGGGDRHMVALVLDGDGGKVKPSLAWQNKREFPYVPSPLAQGENLYFVNDAGLAGCYLAKTGQKVWYERLPGATFTASPVLIDGKIYAASEEGDVFVLAANPAFQLLARNSLGERVRATPAVADNRLFVRGQFHLFCFGEQKGQ